MQNLKEIWGMVNLISTRELLDINLEKDDFELGVNINILEIETGNTGDTGSRGREREKVITLLA